MEATEQQDGAARPGDHAAPDAGAAHDTSDSAAAQVAEDEGAPPDEGVEARRLKWACLSFLMFKTPVEWQKR